MDKKLYLSQDIDGENNVVQDQAMEDTSNLITEKPEKIPAKYQRSKLYKNFMKTVQEMDDVAVCV